jgi:small ligand-binding sensory domain FIST
VLREAIESLDEPSRELLKRNIFMGRAVSEYKDRFGRGDFLVRGVVGVDQESGALAVADLVRVGQTVQFHLRDAATADDDLGLLLDGQKVHEPPVGALLFTCNGRGCRLFDDPNHDALALTRAFLPDPTAEERAKGGQPLGPTSMQVRGGHALPIAGFFAAGEIGPVGDEVFLHGHTASVMLFREEGTEGRRHEGTKG